MDEELIRWGITTLIAILGASVAFYALSKKLFIKIRASFRLVNSAMYDDIYISSVLLINEKDRTEAIYGIYLKCDRYIYIQLKEFESPLLLGPYETVNLDLEPVSWYGLSDTKVNLNSFLSDNPDLRIILSTRRGKHKTKKVKNYWNPIYEQLKSGQAATVHKVQLRSTIDSTNSPIISNNADYLIHCQIAGQRFLFQIFNSQIKRINNPKFFNLNSSSLESESTLINHLTNNEFEDHLGNIIDILSIKRLDDDQEVEIYRNIYQNSIELPSWGVFDYYIIAPLSMWIHDIYLSKKNFRPDNFSSFLERVFMSALPYILIAILIFIVILSNLRN